MAISKEEKFATEMADQLLVMRGEDGYIDFMTDKGNIVPLSFIETILGDQEHVDNIKKKIHDEILGHVIEFPREFKTCINAQGTREFCYSSDIYDYATNIEEYIEGQYDDLIKATEAFDEATKSKARQGRLQINYRVVVSIERVEYDPETGESAMFEESRSIVSIVSELNTADQVKYDLVTKYV